MLLLPASPDARSVFFASPSETTGGKSWCPDCTRVEPTLAKCLPEDRSTLVYVGERDA